MNLRTIAIIGFLSLLILALAACSGATPAPTPPQPTISAQASLPDLPKNADGYVDISVEQLAAAMPDKGFTLVNVHIPYQGELPNTDLFIPFDEISAHQDELPAQDAPIVLYCRSGSMSTQAAQALVDAGYTNVYELDGGFNAWQATGHELLMKQ